MVKGFSCLIIRLMLFCFLLENTSITVLPESFSIPYKNRFEEGEFRKRIPFMFGYHGSDINAVLDKLPSAEYKRQEDGSFIVKAEVYGKTGISMWLRSQGKKIEILSEGLE